MSEVALAPRNAFVGVVGVWCASFLASILIGFFAPEQWRVSWMFVSFGLAVLVSFAVQLAYGLTHGYIVRVAASILGSLLLMGIISVGFGLAALMPG